MTSGRRRALGQNFLKDRRVAEGIVDAALTQAIGMKCASLVEIGPGRGAITHLLLERIPADSSLQKIILIERDRSLAERWVGVSSRIPVEVECADFLELPDEKWVQGSPIGVVSNLPYASGTAILNRLARHTDVIPVMTLMFQAEVAQRLRAEPGTRKRGSLSVWIQNRWDVRKMMSVPPEAFSPPPKVNSEVVILNRRDQSRVNLGADPQSEELWLKLLKDYFAHRRKMLRSVVHWRNALELSGIDGTKRAEDLEWDEWNALLTSAKAIARTAGQ